MSLSRELGEALASEDPEERRRAVPRISELPPSDRVPPLLRALGDDDWRVRKEAIGLSNEIGPEPRLLVALSRAFDPGDNVGLRNAAVEALGGLGLAAVETLGSRMTELDADGKKLAIEALGRTQQAAALDVLAPLTRDRDPNVRLAALEAASAVGGARAELARALLLPSVDSELALERLVALEGLSVLAARLPYERVQGWLAEPLFESAALSLLAHTGDERAARPLVAALRRGSSEALPALADFCSTGGGACAAAIEALLEERAAGLTALLERLSPSADDLEQVRAGLTIAGALRLEASAAVAVHWLTEARCFAEADQALLLLERRAVPALVEAARGRDTERAAASIDLLGRLPLEAVDAVVRATLAEAARSEDSNVARSALEALTRVGDAASLPELVPLLGEAARVSLVEPAIGEIARRDPAAGRALFRFEHDGGVEAHAAALAVAALAPQSELGGALTTGFLTRLLGSTAARERRAALAALAEVGDGEALEAVTFALTDEEPECRLQAVRTLGRLRASDGSAAGVTALIELVTERREAELLPAAIRALGETGDARAIAVLGPLAKSADVGLAVAAVEALARDRDARRLGPLFDALHHADAEVVKAALLGVAAAADPRSLVHLCACLDHPAWDVRRLAADLLGRSSLEASAAHLRARLGVEDDPMVREALSRALEGAAQRWSRRSPRGAGP